MEKIGLVLEGGGLRGAYTAGVLAWFIDNDVHFDYVVGISSGALYGSMYAMGKKESMKKTALEVSTHWRNIGLGPLFFERTFIGYNYLFDTLQNGLDYPIKQMNEVETEVEIGVYDIEAEKTIWVNQDGIAKNPDFVKAACTLPIVGRSVLINGKKYMDGGVTTMIPLHKSIEKGCTKHVVVTTKSADFVREDQGFLQKHALRFLYRKSPRLIEDFEARKEVYYQERAKIDELVDKRQAVYLYPSKELGVSRFGGDKEKFVNLYNLAYADCEQRKESLLRFAKKNK